MLPAGPLIAAPSVDTRPSFSFHVSMLCLSFMNRPLSLITHANLCGNLRQWPTAACLSYQPCIRNRCIFDVGLFVLPYVPKCVSGRTHVCVCVSVFPGPAATSQTERLQMHALTHKQRGRAEDLIFSVQIIKVAICCRTLRTILSIFTIITTDLYSLLLLHIYFISPQQFSKYNNTCFICNPVFHRFHRFIR